MMKRVLIAAVLLGTGGCKSDESDEGDAPCTEECTEGVVIALDAEEWRDGVYEINAVYTTDGSEREVWCMFTRPEADDANCTIDPMGGEAPTLDVGETVRLEIAGAPPSIDLTLYDAHAYIESYTLNPDYTGGCDEACKVAMLSASFAEPQDAGSRDDLTDGSCVEGEYLGVLVTVSGDCGPVPEGFALSLGADGATTNVESRPNADITTMSVVDGCSASVSRTIAEKTGQVVEQFEGDVDRVSDDQLEGELARTRFDASGEQLCEGIYEITLQRTP